MRHFPQIKQLVLLLGFLLPTVFCTAHVSNLNDGPKNISINAAQVQSSPKTASILAYIDGHSLTVTFTENLGTVQIEITTASGGPVTFTDVWTPDSYIAYIPSTGSYVVTITLPNGDEYYGEFEVTD